MSLNLAVIMGRLTADPELKRTPSDIAVTSFTVAIDKGYVKAGTERQADFIDVVAWRNTADFVCKYFKKGQMIAINGSIQTRSYTDNNGNKRKAVEIVADNVSFTESKRDSGNTNQGEFAGGRQNASFDQAPPAPAYSIGSNTDFEEVIGDDDLPF